MANEHVPGTLVLPTLSAVALWKHELLGQLSDGAWENASPGDHWKFWHECDVERRCNAEPTFERGRLFRLPRKTGYDFMGQLYPVVGDRMLRVGRMGRALASLGRGVEALEGLHGCAEDMPEEGINEFRRRQAEGHEHDFITKRMLAVDDALAVRFYTTTYTERDLRKDIASIKRAMKAARPSV